MVAVNLIKSFEKCKTIAQKAIGQTPLTKILDVTEKDFKDTNFLYAIQHEDFRLKDFFLKKENTAPNAVSQFSVLKPQDIFSTMTAKEILNKIQLYMLSVSQFPHDHSLTSFPASRRLLSIKAPRFKVTKPTLKLNTMSGEEITQKIKFKRMGLYKTEDPNTFTRTVLYYG